MSVQLPGVNCGTATRKLGQISVPEAFSCVGPFEKDAAMFPNWSLVMDQKNETLSPGWIVLPLETLLTSVRGSSRFATSIAVPLLSEKRTVDIVLGGGAGADKTATKKQVEGVFWELRRS